MAKKVLDSRKQKEKREKIFLGVGAVLLIGVLAIQAPKLMGSKSSSAAPRSTTPTGLTSVGTLTSAGTGFPTSGGNALVAPADDFTPGPGQLASLAMFATKDPFVQPLTASTPTTPTSPASTSARTTRTSTRTGKTTTGRTTTSPRTTTTGPGSVYLSALISVNGVAEGVNATASFPVASPVFVLKSIASDSVVIGIAGGQLSNGAEGLTLAKGQSVTLVNTADGSRYVVKLLSVSRDAAEIATGTTTTTSSIPPGPVPPTMTSTAATTTTTSTTTGTTTTTS